MEGTERSVYSGRNKAFTLESVSKPQRVIRDWEYITKQKIEGMREPIFLVKKYMVKNFV